MSCTNWHVLFFDSLVSGLDNALIDMFCSSIGWCLVWIMPFSLIDSMTNQIGASFLRKHHDSVELFKWFLHFHLAKSNLLPEDNNPSCERVILSWCKDCILQIMEVINRNICLVFHSPLLARLLPVSLVSLILDSWCYHVPDVVMHDSIL